MRGRPDWIERLLVVALIVATVALVVVQIALMSDG